MSYSNENAPKRRSARLLKSLDLATSSTDTSSTNKQTSNTNENLQDDLYNHINKRLNTLTSKIETNLNGRRTKQLQILVKQKENSEPAPSTDDDDDCIVLSSEDENNLKSSSQRKLSTSTEASSQISNFINETPNLPNLVESIVTSKMIDDHSIISINNPVKLNSINENSVRRASINIETDKTDSNSSIKNSKSNISINNKDIKKLQCVIVSNLDFELADSKRGTSELEDKTNDLNTNVININPEINDVNSNNVKNDTENKSIDDEADDDEDDEPITKVSNKKQILESDSDNEVVYKSSDENEFIDSNDEDDELMTKTVFKNKWCVCDNDSSVNNDKKMCDGKCGQWYHLSCLGYSKEQIQRINNRKLEQNERFICPVCNNDEKFIENYKKAIDYRRKHYSSYQKSSSSSSSETEASESEQDNDTDAEKTAKKSTKKKLISELNENDKKEKLEKLKKNQKQPNQTKLIDSSQKFNSLKSHSSSLKSKSSTLQPTYKSLIDKTTSAKEKSKIAITSSSLKHSSSTSSSLASSSSSSSLNQKFTVDPKFCHYCNKHLPNEKSVPNKLAQSMLFDNPDELKSNWNFSIYCDEKCILNYIDIELTKRQTDLATSKQKDSPNFDIKRKYIYLLDHITKQRHICIVTLNKTQEDLKKEIYSKLSKQPKHFIVDLDHLDSLLASNTIQKPNSTTNTTAKLAETIKKPTTSINKPSTLTSSTSFQRSISIPSKTISNTSKLIVSAYTDFRSKFKDQLMRIIKTKIESNSDLTNHNYNLDEIVNEIEMSFHYNFQKDENMYKKRVRKVSLNLSMEGNDLYLRILKGQIKPSDLATLSDELLNESRTKERQEATKANIELLKKYSDEINESKLQHLKKTHKGEEIIYFEYAKKQVDNNNKETQNNKSLNDSSDVSHKSDNIEPVVSTTPTITTPHLNNYKTVSPSLTRSISMPINKPNSPVPLIKPSSTIQSDINNKQINSNNKTKARRHDSDFESDEDEQVQVKTSLTTSAIEKPIPLMSSFLKPSLIDPVPIKPAELRPIGILPASLPVSLLSLTTASSTSISTTKQPVQPPTNVIQPSKHLDKSLSIDTITFNLQSSGPSSPPTNSLLLSSLANPNYMWSGEIVLKTLLANMEHITFLKANLLRSFKIDPLVDSLSKAVVDKFQYMPQMKFDCETRHRLSRDKIHFWSYLTKLKRDFQIPLLFMVIESNGEGKNTINCSKDDPSDCMHISDSQGFFQLRNNLDKNYVYEYKINEELKSLIGYFYVVVLKSKSNGNEKWFQENLYIDVDRTNKDVVFGVLIDAESKKKHSLPADFSLDSTVNKTVLAAPKPRDTPMLPGHNPPVSVLAEDKLKRKVSDSSPNDLDEMKRKKIEEVKTPNQTSESNEPVHKVNLDRDPRINRVNSKTNESNQNESISTSISNKLIVNNESTKETTKNDDLDRDPRTNRVNSKTNESNQNETNSTTSSNKPSEQPSGQTAESEFMVPKPTSSLILTPIVNNEPIKETSKNDKFDIVKYLDTVLSKLDKDNLDERNAALFNFYLMPERKLLTTEDKKLLSEKYLKIFPDFVILINDNDVNKNNEANVDNDKVEETNDESKMPPIEMWQGTDKDAVLNLYKIHKEYKKNKHIKNFTFENENWYLNESSFKKPDIVVDDNEENDIDIIDETTSKKSPEPVYRKVILTSHSSYSERYGSNNNFDCSNKNKPNTYSSSNRYSNDNTNSSNNSNNYSGNFSNFHSNKRSRSPSHSSNDSNKFLRKDKD